MSNKTSVLLDTRRNNKAAGRETYRNPGLSKASDATNSTSDRLKDKAGSWSVRPWWNPLWAVPRQLDKSNWDKAFGPHFTVGIF
ncbi:hypothetical protein HBI56_191260 [Parastagonospora nodorum]|uniref:Uncharacterized protein n=2 Tax=Phaeosphaeria nodorum (strain SN15 / ATCC MYA-4574 / FGSC 10173) TaxID=321614 RepID=A0A7U2NQ02_PHANO|nr:hypothetical protein SNOG_14773 [Parastagonospora nodorum SN15]KAH3908214.1 hypothetical protein HBH56_179190 [Parastagonospora nodorum]EAT77965.1 hypothetical protein SNOG_14773 [Parastagonospora nodorum SN15]KAH3932165.1 hypothetical protein HBH54_090640 [Parastagonospora nodorum]KAH3939233.1 hypothetical protein HBH53_237740 [Parastagonospora nodorum]KAH3956816.1 hypothetical protein HBH51_234860 [Parastagonospora nodorum]